MELSLNISQKQECLPLELHSKHNIISLKGFFDCTEDWNDSLYNCFWFSLDN